MDLSGEVNRVIRLAFAALPALLLAACASLGGDFAIDAFARQQVTGGDAAMCLTRGYQTEVRRARRDRDMEAARILSERGWAAFADRPPAPDRLVSDYGGVRPALEKGRAALLAATAAASWDTACACAAGQAAFDAWAIMADRERLANRLPRLIRRPGDPDDPAAAQRERFGAWLLLCRGTPFAAG